MADTETNTGVAVPARAGRASPEPASSLGHTATIANAGDILGKLHRQMWHRAELRSKWLSGLAKEHPLRVLAELRLAADCYLSRPAQADKIHLMHATAAAREIEDEIFAQWRAAQGTSGSAQDAQRLDPQDAGPVAEGHAPEDSHD